MTRQSQLAARFAALHRHDESFVIPNPWSVPSARLLEGMGFPALATTSSGLALELGKRDGEATLEEVIAHCRALCEATGVPVSADLENCYADSPDAAAKNLLRAAETGIVGASIEDFSGRSEAPIYDRSLAVERVAAAVEAVRTLPFHFTLTARAENLIRGRMDLDDTIQRLQAFEAAGADVLYAPGLTTLREVELVAGSVSAPINVLVPPFRGVAAAALGAAGAQRLSLGGALARAVYTSLVEAGREIREHGTFGWAEGTESFGALLALVG